MARKPYVFISGLSLLLTPRSPDDSRLLSLGVHAPQVRAPQGRRPTRQVRGNDRSSVHPRASACDARKGLPLQPDGLIPTTTRLSSTFPCNNPHSTEPTSGDKAIPTRARADGQGSTRSRAPKRARPTRAGLIVEDSRSFTRLWHCGAPHARYVARWRRDARARLACATRLRTHTICSNISACRTRTCNSRKDARLLITSRMSSYARLFRKREYSRRRYTA